jgi:hypothetical protein
MRELSTSSEEKMHDRDGWDNVLPVKTKVSRLLNDVY